MESTAAAYRAARAGSDNGRAVEVADGLVTLLELEEEAQLRAALDEALDDLTRPDRADREAVGVALDNYLAHALRLLAVPELGEEQRLALAKRVEAAWASAEFRTWRA